MCSYLSRQQTEVKWLLPSRYATQDWVCLLGDELSTEDMEVQLSQQQHQSASVSSFDDVCPALQSWNLDTFGCWHRHARSISYEVPATDSTYILLSSVHRHGAWLEYQLPALDETRDYKKLYLFLLSFFCGVSCTVWISVSQHKGQDRPPMLVLQLVLLNEL